MVLNQSKVVRIDPGEVALDARRGARLVSGPTWVGTRRGLGTAVGGENCNHIATVL
jgi:hypothetical protein